MKKSLQENPLPPTGELPTPYRRISASRNSVFLALMRTCEPDTDTVFLPFFLSLYRGVGARFLFLEKLMQIDCGMLDDVLEFFSERLEHASLIHCERSRLCTR